MSHNQRSLVSILAILALPWLILPVGALLLASVFLISCVALGSVIWAASTAVRDKTAAEPVPHATRIHEEDHRKAA